MKIIYIHGLDSSANSAKGLILQAYCEQHYPSIQVMRPDLNQAPDKVFALLCQYVEQAQHSKEQVMVMGSSLGGYFANLVSNKTGCPAVLLNPSTKPHRTLQRFVSSTVDSIALDASVYTTTGGWELTLRDLDWFDAHKLIEVTYPQKVVAIIKTGDELLNPTIAIDFYQKQRVKVVIQEGGDHRMTDFDSRLTQIMSHISLLTD